MDKTVAGLLTTVTAFALSQPHPAKAAPAASYAAALEAGSYAELLTPIANARDLLAAAPRDPQVVQVQDNEHHHHHHVVHHRRRHHRPPPPPVDHHHHHHHNWQMP